MSSQPTKHKYRVSKGGLAGGGLYVPAGVEYCEFETTNFLLVLTKVPVYYGMRQGKIWRW